MKKILLIICLIATPAFADLFDEIEEYDTDAIITDFCVRTTIEFEKRKGRNSKPHEEILAPPYLFTVMNECNPPGYPRPFFNLSIKDGDSVLVLNTSPKIPRPIVINPFIPDIPRPDQLEIVTPRVSLIFASINVNTTPFINSSVNPPSILPLFGNFPIVINPMAYRVNVAMLNNTRLRPSLSIRLFDINGFIDLN